MEPALRRIANLWGTSREIPTFMQSAGVAAESLKSGSTKVAQDLRSLVEEVLAQEWDPTSLSG